MMLNELPPRLRPEQMISIIENGLKTTIVPKKIIIVGAGMAGLVAASLLKDAGHNVIVIEASDRVGGRVYTLRSPFGANQYLDVGPMRIPSNHYLTLAYTKKFRLPVNLFINSTPKDIIYVNGVKTNLKTYQRKPDILNFPLAPNEKGKTAEELFFLAVSPIVNFINQNPQRNWSIAAKEFEKYSLDTFLRHNPVSSVLSPGAVDMIKTIFGIEGVSEQSFIEILREVLILANPEINFYEITGGFDKLPRAFLPQLQEDILFQQKMTKIVQHDNQVTIHSVESKTSQPFSITGDLAIITVPFSVLQFVEVEPYHSFSYYKRKAIRTLQYVPTTKIGLQFKSRFWEKEGMYGGRTISDMPIVYNYYPSHGFDQPKGVVLASYTWGNDAIIWDSMSKEERIRQALKYLAIIHGNHIYREFETGVAYSWVQNPFSAGAFALFKPEQETELYPYLSSPEGRVHFAGEHTSLPHAWIQTAIESGIRVADEVNDLRRTFFSQ
jgi:monoamine oxidase